MRACRSLFLAFLLLPVLPACEAMEDPEGIRVTVDSPLRVALDEEFQILVRITNEAAADQTLVDLDVADRLLEGIHIRSMEPAFSDAFHVPIDNTQSYSLDLALPAGREVVVTVNATALHEGDYAGDLDLCINSAVSCLSYPVRTLVGS